MHTERRNQETIATPLANCLGRAEVYRCVCARWVHRNEWMHVRKRHPTYDTMSQVRASRNYIYESFVLWPGSRSHSLHIPKWRENAKNGGEEKKMDFALQHALGSAAAANFQPIGPTIADWERRRDNAHKCNLISRTQWQCAHGFWLGHAFDCHHSPHVEPHQWHVRFLRFHIDDIPQYKMIFPQFASATWHRR